jgi:hypothetical protein
MDLNKSFLVGKALKINVSKDKLNITTLAVAG